MIIAIIIGLTLTKGYQDHVFAPITQQLTFTC